MDVLKNKQNKQYQQVSRYASFPFYYHTKDDKYVYGLTGQLETDIAYVLVKVNQKDTLDSLALRYYGRPDYYWIIADFNHIVDAYEDIYPKYDTLKIPSISQISFKE